MTDPVTVTVPLGDRAYEVRIGQGLLADEKERAEHLMLVDLSRNDLSKVCEPGSVEVTEFMTIERFSHIMHLCSNVVGRMRPDVSAYDVLAAAFPAGAGALAEGAALAAGGLTTGLGGGSFTSGTRATLA